MASTTDNGRIGLTGELRKPHTLEGWNQPESRSAPSFSFISQRRKDNTKSDMELDWAV